MIITSMISDTRRCSVRSAPTYNAPRHIAHGFTLIELLVVIAIIGILSSVVVASLNTARQKGIEAIVKSNFSNAIRSVELSYDNTNSYSGACAAITPNIASINATGAVASCWSYDGNRWGATAKNAAGTQNWSVDSTGVVKWDAAYINASAMTWDAAVAACAAAGARMPSFEQLESLSAVYGSTTPTTSGFRASNYWSGTEYPTNPANAYLVGLNSGALGNLTKTGSGYVRCVR